MELTGFLTASHWTCLLSVVRPEKHITEFLGYRSAAEIGSKKTALLPQDSKTRPVEKESKISGVELTLFFGPLDHRIWQILRFDHQFQNLDHLILKCHLHFHFCFKLSDLLL